MAGQLVTAVAIATGLVMVALLLALLIPTGRARHSAGTGRTGTHTRRGARHRRDLAPPGTRRRDTIPLPVQAPHPSTPMAYSPYGPRILPEVTRAH